MSRVFLLSVSILSISFGANSYAAQSLPNDAASFHNAFGFQMIAYNTQATKDLIALTQAKKTDDVAALKKFLDQGADINAKNGFGATALAMAADNGHTEAVKLLVARKADVNLVENRGVTPLFMASLKGYGEIVNILLSAKADPDVKDARRGFAALSVAAQFGHLNVVRSLVKAGADVNTQSNSGKTPLYMAVQKKGNFDVVSALLSAKADLLLGEKTKDGVRTPLLEAYKAGDKKIINAIEASLPSCIQSKKMGDWDVMIKPGGYTLTPKLTKVKDTKKNQSITFSKYKDKVSFNYNHTITGHSASDAYKIYVDNQMVFEAVYDVEYKNDKKVSETMPVIPLNIIDKMSSGQSAKVQHIRFAKTNSREGDVAYFSLQGMGKAIEIAEKGAELAEKEKASGRCAVFNIFALQ